MYEEVQYTFTHYFKQQHSFANMF